MIKNLNTLLTVGVLLAIVAVTLFQISLLTGRVIPPYNNNLQWTERSLSRFDAIDSLDLDNSKPWRRSIEIVHLARSVTDRNDVILVFLQNAFAYYADRTLIRDVDTRMIPFYKAQDRGTALEHLKSLEISHVYIPPIPGWPTIARSLILDILEDTDSAELLFNHHDHKFYKIK